MALNKTQSMFVGSLKKAAPSAHKKSRDTEVQITGGGLPDGISRGIACFTDYKLGEISKGKAKGKKYISLKSTVVEPTEFRGLSANKTIYFRETANKSIADQIASFNNELKKLGADLAGTTEDDWFGILDALKDESPFHYFHTWKGDATPQYPNPQVNTEFDGCMGLEDYQDPNESDEGVEDNTEDESEDDSEAPFEEEDGEEQSWAEIGADADEGDETCIEMIETKAEGSDVDHSAFETYAEVGEILDGMEEEEEGEEDEEEEEDDEGEEEGEDFEPGKGEVYNYQPPRAKDSHPCTVTAVFNGTQKVNLKRVSDDKSFRGVPWDKLEA